MTTEQPTTDRHARIATVVTLAAAPLVILLLFIGASADFGSLERDFMSLVGLQADEPGPVSDYSAASIREPAPVLVDIHAEYAALPGLVGRTVSEVSAEVTDTEVLGFSETLHAMRPHAGNVSAEATVSVAVLLTNTGSGRSAILLRFGSAESSPTPIAWPTWLTEHDDSVRENGATGCFDCHSENSCSDCHVRRAADILGR